MTAPATTFLAETHERFLRAVVTRLPVERIIELHLFPSIKQGGVESGVAVVAVLPEGEVATGVGGGAVDAAPAEAPASATTEETGETEEAAETEKAMPEGGAIAAPSDADGVESSPEVPSDDDAVGPPPQPQDAAAGAVSPHPNDAFGAEPSREADAGAESPAGEPPSADASEPPQLTPDALVIGDAEAPVEIDADEAERLEDAVHAIVDDVEDPAAQAMAAASLELADLPAAEAARRYTIYSARYRLVLKGPDRGKWAVDVVAQADAPLVTVESVVRGVQRRAGDADEVGRWSGEELRVALRLPAPGGPPSGAPPA